MKKLFTSRRLTTLVGLVILTGAVMLRMQQPEFLRRMQTATFDTYNRMWPRPFDLSSAVRIADFNDDTLNKMGQWPWPRDRIAALVDKLKAMGASAIVFDMVFAEPDGRSPRALAEELAGRPDTAAFKNLAESLPDTDAVLAESIRRAGNVTTGFSFTIKPTETAPRIVYNMTKTFDKPSPFAGTIGRDIPPTLENMAGLVGSFPGAATNIPVLENAAAANAHFTLSSDVDGIIRGYPLLFGKMNKPPAKKTFHPALGLAALQVAEKTGSANLLGPEPGFTFDGQGEIRAIRVGRHEIPTTEDGRLRLYFSGHQESRFLPIWRILAGEVPNPEVAGHIILIGTSAAGLMDLRFVPVGRQQVPGVEIHAEAIEQIRANAFLYRTFQLEMGEYLGMILAGLLLIWLLPRTGAITSAAIGAAAVASGLGISVAGYRMGGLLIDPVYPGAVTLLLYVVCLSLDYLHEERQRQQIRRAFAHYLSPALIEELAEKPEQLHLGGQVRPLSVMFSDIRGFSTISEKLTPEQLTQTLNDFLTPMTTIIMDNRGTIDKYIGDAIMAFWNAPLPDADHARGACRAAIAMQDAMQAVNAKIAENSSEGITLKIGIGINTGPSCVGNMGSEQRFAYSALGDAVNLASRLESQTKTYHVPIILGEATHAGASDFAALEIDLITVKGKTRPERIFALMGDEKIARANDFTALKTAHDGMIAAYRAREWTAAETALAACRTLAPAAISGLYDVYAERIAAFRASPPPPEWTGVYVALTK